jgi:hypothetical protein
VLARLQRRRHDRRVQVVRQAHADDLDRLVVHDRLRVGVLRRPRKLLEQRLAARRDQVRDRDDLKAAGSRVALGVFHPGPAGAHDSHPDSLCHP